jgi:hypothetical protein
MLLPGTLDRPLLHQEVEARFWLVDQLNAIEKARKIDPELN